MKKHLVFACKRSLCSAPFRNKSFEHWQNDFVKYKMLWKKKEIIKSLSLVFWESCGCSTFVLSIWKPSITIFFILVLTTVCYKINRNIGFLYYIYVPLMTWKPPLSSVKDFHVNSYNSCNAWKVGLIARLLKYPICNVNLYYHNATPCNTMQQFCTDRVFNLLLGAIMTMLVCHLTQLLCLYFVQCSNWWRKQSCFLRAILNHIQSQITVIVEKNLVTLEIKREMKSSRK